jgi:hypothetical protein
MSVQRFEFDGVMLTVREVHKRVPRFSESAVRSYLRAGAKTRQEVMQQAEAAQRSRVIGGRRGAQKSKGKWGRL